MDQWIKEAGQDENASLCGMYLFHNGVVRSTARAKVRGQEVKDRDSSRDRAVTGMVFDYDPEKVDHAVAAARRLPGIYYVRVWLNRGQLEPGDDIMLVLVGGDIRPHVIDALQSLVGELKNHCVTEQEIY